MDNSTKYIFYKTKAEPWQCRADRNHDQDCPAMNMKLSGILLPTQEGTERLKSWTRYMCLLFDIS